MIDIFAYVSNWQELELRMLGHGRALRRFYIRESSCVIEKMDVYVNNGPHRSQFMERLTTVASDHDTSN